MKDNHFRLRNKKGPTCKIDDRTDGRTIAGRSGAGMNNELGVSHHELDGVGRVIPLLGQAKHKVHHVSRGL